MVNYLSCSSVYKQGTGAKMYLKLPQLLMYHNIWTVHVTTTSKVKITGLYACSKITININFVSAYVRIFFIQIHLPKNMMVNVWLCVCGCVHVCM